MVRLFPSLIASNPLNIEKTVHRLQDSCSGFHVDVMDNQFVPNIAFTLETVNAIHSAAPLVIWTHLMVYKPAKYLEKMTLKEQDIISIHYESAPVEELKVIFRKLQDMNVVASCALLPKTPVSVLHELMGYIDHVLIMSVNAGFSGQKFLHETVFKLQQLQKFQNEHNTQFTVGVDGGINLATIQEVLPYHVTDIALGSSVFFGSNPAEKLEQFANII